MDSGIELELHFHNPYLAAVKYLPHNMSREELEIWRDKRISKSVYYELLLYSCFANREMTNFGINSGEAYVLSKYLARIGKDIHEDAIIERFNGQIEQYSGIPSKDAYTMVIKGKEKEDWLRNVKFNLQVKGCHSHRGSTVYWHAKALDVLARYLDNRRNRVEPYSKYLRHCAIGCSELYEQSALSMFNQMELAIGIVNQILCSNRI